MGEKVAGNAGAVLEILMSSWTMVSWLLIKSICSWRLCHLNWHTLTTTTNSLLQQRLPRSRHHVYNVCKHNQVCQPFIWLRQHSKCRVGYRNTSQWKSRIRTDNCPRFTCRCYQHPQLPKRCTILMDHTLVSMKSSLTSNQLDWYLQRNWSTFGWWWTICSCWRSWRRADAAGAECWWSRGAAAERRCGCLFWSTSA